MELESPTPHGVGGLKFLYEFCIITQTVSHPSRGGWIEINLRVFCFCVFKVPPLTGWVD